jgi:hypothetical protein
VQTTTLVHDGATYTSTDSCGTDQGLGRIRGKINPWSWSRK